MSSNPLSSDSLSEGKRLERPLHDVASFPNEYYNAVFCTAFTGKKLLDEKKAKI